MRSMKHRATLNRVGKTIPFIIAIKIINYLEINLTK